MNKAQEDHAEWGKMYNQMAAREPDEIRASSRYGVISKKVIRKTGEDIARKLDLNPEDDLLDLGCGTGMISIALSQRAGSITGMDIGEDVLKRTRRYFERAGKDIELIQGDITCLPFKDGAFDKILCYSVAMCLHDYADFEKALCEMFRVCRQNGKILIGDIPNTDKKARWIRGKRLNKEPLLQYLIRKSGQSITRYRYKISAGRFTQKNERLNIYRPQACGMFYESEKILAICRKTGINGKLLDQPANLAFGNTRIDLLVEK